MEQRLNDIIKERKYDINYNDSEEIKKVKESLQKAIIMYLNFQLGNKFLRALLPVMDIHNLYILQQKLNYSTTRDYIYDKYYIDKNFIETENYIDKNCIKINKTNFKLNTIEQICTELNFDCVKLNRATNDSLKRTVKKIENRNTIIYLSKNIIYSVRNNIWYVGETDTIDDELCEKISVVTLLTQKELFKDHLEECKEYLEGNVDIIDKLEQKYGLSTLMNKLEQSYFVEDVYKIILDSKTEKINIIKKSMEELYEKYKESSRELDIQQGKLMLLKTTMEQRCEDLLKFLKNNQQICTFNVFAKENEINITICTKLLPLVFLDTDVLKTVVEYNTWDISQRNIDVLKLLLEKNYYLAITPVETSIKINTTNNHFKTSFRQMCGRYTTPNGHAAWLAGSGCLGTFRIEIQKEIAELNLKKIVSLLLQFLMTVAPSDRAGSDTLKRDLILLDDQQNIVNINGVEKNIPMNNVKYTERYIDWRIIEE